MFSAFFLTLSPTSFPLGSTYSKLESAFTNQNRWCLCKKRLSCFICQHYWELQEKQTEYKRIALTEIWKVCSIMSSTARSDPCDTKYSITANAWHKIEREVISCIKST
jgi:hypothetical protein